jgi:outer membrane immunogenic protein
MKRFLLSSVAMAALMGSAAAADIPRRVEQARAPVAYVTPLYNWTGFYVGINGGGGWGDSNFSGTPGTGDFNVSGGLVGGTFGYNYQVGQWVFGVEGDLAWSNIDGSAACGALTCSTKNKWLSTVRGRLGYAADRFMPYVTGGAAFGEVEASATGQPGVSDTRSGWTVGGGVEFAVAAPWTAKLEYLFVDLGSFDCGTSCGALPPDNVSFQSHIARAGLNYRF